MKNHNNNYVGKRGKGLSTRVAHGDSSLKAVQVKLLGNGC